MTPETMTADQRQAIENARRAAAVPEGLTPVPLTDAERAALRGQVEQELARAAVVRDALQLRDVLKTFRELAKGSGVEGLRQAKMTLDVRDVTALLALAVGEVEPEATLIPLNNFGRLLIEATRQDEARRGQVEAVLAANADLTAAVQRRHADGLRNQELAGNRILCLEWAIRDHLRDLADEGRAAPWLDEALADAPEARARAGIAPAPSVPVPAVNG